MIITKRKHIAQVLILLALTQGYLGFKQWKTAQQLDEAHAVYSDLETNPQDFHQLEDTPPMSALPVPSPSSSDASAPEYVFSYNPNPASEFLQKNSDYVGHLYIPGTKINYPMVRAQDNEYYLDHNFFREKDALGSIFMDYRNIGMHLDKHTIIYGHYTERGYMFGDLDKYLDKEYLLENQIIEFSTPQGVKFFKIFSIHISPKINSYLDTTFEKISFSDFVSTLSDISLIEGLEKPDVTKQLLTLSTCNYAIKDGRLFVHAIEIDNPN